MAYFKKLIKFGLFWILLLTPIFVDFLISWLNGTLEPLSLTRYLIKILQVLKVNISYYATIVAIGLSYMKYLSDEKEHEESRKELQEKLLREEMKSNQLKEIELENYRDQYRPTFVRKNGKLILLMRRNNLYLRNVRFFRSDLTVGKYLEDLKHGEAISLNDIEDNYYISGETLLGEKILFGNILKNVQVYKALKMGCEPIEKNLSIDEIEKLLNNWIPFNTVQININDSNVNEKIKSHINKIDRLFMSRTQLIRGFMWLTSSDNLLENMIWETIPELFSKILKYINNDHITYDKKSALIRVLESILEQNSSEIKINLKEIEKGDWIRLTQYLNIEDLQSKKTEISANDLYLNSKRNSNDINMFSILVKYLKIEESVNAKLLDYTDIIYKILEEE